MAIGYQIALLLEGAGFLCLCAALWRLRAERRSEACALKTTLVVGASGQHAPRPRRDAIRMVPLARTPRAETAPGAARRALRRAYAG